MNTRVFAAAIGLAALLAACGSSKSSTAQQSANQTGASTTVASDGMATVKTGTAAKVGTVLVDASGRTLYTFDPENSGTIVCTASCAKTWPPLVVTGQPVAASGVTGLATLSRPDGATQVTFNGHPLYRYSNDAAPGDANGDGLGGVWHAAKAKASTTTTTTGGSSYTYG
jgi:predicted lipoprotein with Yx(FWY)xxD motif